jgi:hypothetical protein
MKEEKLPFLLTIINQACSRVLELTAGAKIARL